MGSHIIILNSIKAAHDLLDNRSPIYSDRYGIGPNGATHFFHVLIQHSLDPPWPLYGICMSNLRLCFRPSNLSIKTPHGL
jgi:hypothetical protein